MDKLERIHHIGYVVADVERAAEGFARSLGARILTPAIHDPLQKAYVLFLQIPGDVAQWELVGPAGTGSPVATLAARGGGLHHVCYEVADLDGAVAQARAARSAVIRPAKPAVAFDGRRIAWVLTAEKLLVEYLEIVPAQSR